MIPLARIETCHVMLWNSLFQELSLTLKNCQQFHTEKKRTTDDCVILISDHLFFASMSANQTNITQRLTTPSVPTLVNNQPQPSNTMKKKKSHGNRKEQHRRRRMRFREQQPPINNTRRPIDDDDDVIIIEDDDQDENQACSSFHIVEYIIAKTSFHCRSIHYNITQNLDLKINANDMC